MKYKLLAPSLRSSVSAAAILASALAFVKYKLLAPSLRSSVSAAAILASALAFVKYKLLAPSATLSVSKAVMSTLMLSAATLIPVPAPTLSVTPPLAPPPVKPEPAVTDSMSPGPLV